MKKVLVGCMLVLVLCIGYVKLSYAMPVTCSGSSSGCEDRTDYHNRLCKEWCVLTEIPVPDAWTYAERNREPRYRWYGVKTGEKMVRMVLEGVHFDFDKYNLRPDTIPILERNIAKLKSMKINRINVIGYTDSKGTETYNQALSERRAKAVKDYLVKEGIASDRIMVEGRGESGEVAPNVTASGADNPAGRAKNRRAIELQIWTQ